MTLPLPSWQARNQRHLALALKQVQRMLTDYIAQTQTSESPPVPEPQLEEPSASNPDRPLALEILCDSFALTAFERFVLLLCAGVELSAELARLCAQAQGDPRFTYATLSLALAVFPDADWSALTPVAPLRRWQLIQVLEGDSLTQSRLRIDEWVLHYLNGVAYLDDRLQGLVHEIAPPLDLAPSQTALVDQLVDCWTRPRGGTAAVQLYGPDLESQRAIAAEAAASLGWSLQAMAIADLPPTAPERELLARLWEREAMLGNSLLLLALEERPEPGLTQALRPFLETVQCPLVVIGPEPLIAGQRPLRRWEVPPLSPSEQQQLWQQALGAGALNGRVAELVAQFNLGPQAIRLASLGAVAAAPDDTFQTLWQTCRQQARLRLDDLAQRITPTATWADLVLPAAQRQLLQDIADQVRQRSRVYESWAFPLRGADGRSVSALFAGASGTGKTLAAEVLAHDLQLDLYRIDLSQVVSKYIGETEKNLRRVFEAAEAGGAILLFDEADALFGKRSEVKDSHDRYANIEVSYLLQRMEAYRGLAILTTNLKSAIDSAFMRRIRFVVSFPFPDREQRAQIWQRMFPPTLPTENLDLRQLAQLNVAGGHIRNIALNAAFLAAATDQPVRMAHLLRAAQQEYAKLEKNLASAEVSGWR